MNRAKWNRTKAFRISNWVYPLFTLVITNLIAYADLDELKKCNATNSVIFGEWTNRKFLSISISMGNDGYGYTKYCLFSHKKLSEVNW